MSLLGVRGRWGGRPTWAGSPPHCSLTGSPRLQDHLAWLGCASVQSVHASPRTDTATRAAPRDVLAPPFISSERQRGAGRQLCAACWTQCGLMTPPSRLSCSPRRSSYRSSPSGHGQSSPSRAETSCAARATRSRDTPRRAFGLSLTAATQLLVSRLRNRRGSPPRHVG